MRSKQSPNAPDWAWSREGNIVRRTLPSSRAAGVDPIAKWLDERATIADRPRVFTVHNFGSYLVWRLPRYSISIDGRTIFPDSVELAEATTSPTRNGRQLGPWRSSDLAIVPLSYSVSAVLDTATGWHRAFTVDSTEGWMRPIGLWIRDEWGATHLHQPLPSQ